jgi:hypothetical protein
LRPELGPVVEQLRGLAATPTLAYDGTNEQAYTAGIRALLARVIERFVEIQRLYGAPPETTFDDSFGDLFGDIFEQAPAPVSPAPPGPNPRPGDLCFGGALEMSAALRQLDEARSLDEVLMACEAGQRKARRALRAVIEAADSSETTQEAFPETQSGIVDAPDADAESALAVRRSYARFRRSLRRPASDSLDDLLTAMRYAAGALATLLTATDSINLRVSDRVMLRSLRDRVFEWARSERNIRAGQHVLEDVYTSADLLRGINHRQELRAHDRSVIATLLAFGDQADGADMVLRLEGLDDALDDLLERRSKEGVLAVRAALQKRLSELA